MLEALSISLNKAAVLGFVMYILGAAVLFALFQFIYTRVTPHKEFELIRSGNVAAAIALGGAVIGFAIPASNVIAYSISMLDFVVWAVIAAVVQLLAFLVTSLVLKGASARIKDNTISGKIAKMVFEAMANGEGSADEIIEKRGLKQVTDTGAISAVLDEMLAANAEQVEQYRAADEAKRGKMFGFFVGQAMKASKGKANPQQVNELLKSKLEG